MVEGDGVSNQQSRGCTPAPTDSVRASTGIAGLDAILGGGLARNHSYLIQGANGSGKTTLGLQFAIAGADQGERVLYLTTCESEAEVREVARSHGWSLDGVVVHYHDVRGILGEEPQQSVFYPAEVELPRTIEALLAALDRVDPQRLVVDSLSELRLLAADPRWFRRQVLLLKDNLASRCCTTLFCDDRVDRDQPINSIVHGIINLEQLARDYGPDHRRLRLSKMRGQTYATGYHDLRIRTGGLDVYPRLIAADHRVGFTAATISSGVAELDTLLGGGADRGTATLLLGPAGTGKSTVATQFAVTSAQRGEQSAMYLFDERVQTLIGRARGLGMKLDQSIAENRIEIRQIDPAELTTGQFSQMVSEAVTERAVRLVIIDSLAGYFQAMPDERSLALHLHELLSYLNQQGVTVMLVMAQHGLAGAQHSVPVDLSYISDTVLLFYAFEYAGEIRKAISVYKRRGGPHERTLRELQFDCDGIHIGEPLRQFHGILTGTPRFLGGETPNVRNDD